MKSIKKIAAIFAIIMSSYMTTFLVTIVLNEFESVRNSGLGNITDAVAGNWYRSLSSVGYTLAVIGFLLNISIIVLGCIFCKERLDKGIAIALLSVIVLSIITVISFGVEYKDYRSSSIEGLLLIYTLIMVAVIILTVFYLIMAVMNKVKFERPMMVSAIMPTAVSTACAIVESKIAVLKQLKKEGTITDAEYKKRVLEVIDAK